MIGFRCPRGVPGASARGYGAQQGERMQTGFGAREVLGIFPLRKRQIKIGDGFDKPGQFFGVGGDFVTKFGENAVFFVALVELELAVFVVEVHDADGFHEEGGPGGGLVVDDGFDFAFEVGAEGDDVTTIAGGDEVVLQVGRDVWVVEHPLHPGEEAVVDDAKFAADGGEARGGVVVDVTALGDDFGDGVNEAVGLRKAAGDFREDGELVLGAFKETG